MYMPPMRENLLADLKQLNVSSEAILPSSTVRDLQGIIQKRSYELMEIFPPGTFIRVYDNEVHLVKAYTREQGHPTALITESDGRQRNLRINVLVNSQIVTTPEDPDLIAKAASWTKRHQFFLDIQERIQAVIRTDERILFDLNHVERATRELINKVWPTNKKVPNPPHIEDYQIADFLRVWLEETERKLEVKKYKFTNESTY